MLRRNNFAVVHESLRGAEVGFLLVLFAGICLAATQVPKLRLRSAGNVLAGGALALAGLFLVVVTHWGHFAHP